MRKRAIKISVRLNEQEHEHLKKQAMIAGRPIEPFIRALITGIELRPRPPDELAELLRQLSGMAVTSTKSPRSPMPAALSVWRI